MRIALTAIIIDTKNPAPEQAIFVCLSLISGDASVNLRVFLFFPAKDHPSSSLGGAE